jgi:Na+/melibiose symporter-like transporter
MEARSFGGLFHGVNLRITITIWVIFCFYNVVSSGIQVITPYILEESNSGFLPSLLSYIAEILAIIFVVSLIDNEKWGGRKKCQIYGLVMLSIVQLAVWYFEKSFLAVGQILQRFAIRIVWLCFDALPVESYTTVYRSMGVGAA